MIARLERIEALEAAGAPPGVVLDEVRGLLVDAEAWVRTEPRGTRLAETALERCLETLRHADATERARAGL